MSGNCGESSWRLEQQRRERYYAERSAEWFASVKEGDTIPDLDFDTPLCSICTRSTCYEDGQFYCETCNVWWPRTGYGSQATRYDDEGYEAPLTGSPATGGEG